MIVAAHGAVKQSIEILQDAGSPGLRPTFKVSRKSAAQLEPRKPIQLAHRWAKLHNASRLRGSNDP
ncbi:hypothetical protein LAD77_00355 [Klebsiella pneumoniae]|nr:hypothetical protein [Klebsiella pneumoniae]